MMNATSDACIPEDKHAKGNASEPSSFFSAYKFPYLKSNDDKICTMPFLEACKGLVKFTELLGPAFIPMRSDLNGNIEKLTKINNLDPVKFQHLDGFLLHENLLEYEYAKFGVDALLWLMRGLEFLQTFLRVLIEEYDRSNFSEDITPQYQKAYDLTLKQYHNWVIQKLFWISKKVLPSRSSLMIMLGNGMEGMETIVYSDLREYLNGMDANMNVIHNLFENRE